MFGFLFSKKSKSVDKESGNKSKSDGCGNKKGKEGGGGKVENQESVGGASKGSLQSSGSDSNSNSSGEFVFSIGTDSERDSSSSDLSTHPSHSTASLPNDHYGRPNTMNIRSTFHTPDDDIPFHDEDTEDDEKDVGKTEKSAEEVLQCMNEQRNGDTPCAHTQNPSQLDAETEGNPHHDIQNNQTEAKSNNSNNHKAPADDSDVPRDLKVDDYCESDLKNDCDKLIQLPPFLATPEPLLKNERDVAESEKKTVRFDDSVKNGLSEKGMEELRSKILAKETEVCLLQADINMLTVDRDNKAVEMEGMETKIMVLNVENESGLEKIKQLEDELEGLRKKNSQLTDETRKVTEQLKNMEGAGNASKSDNKTVTELQSKIKGLEDKLEKVENERKKIVEERDAVEVEREEELRALQNALDDAIEAKIKIQNKFERDYEELRTTNSMQESQLMEDFEWKLRQIEATCKKKLQDKDRQVEEKLKEAQILEVKEVGEEREKLRQERRLVEEQMKQVNHYKSYEAEVVQLRGVVQEQQKALRAASRQLEHFKLNDKVLQDEIRTLRISLEKEKTHAQVVQASSQRRLDAHEETLQAKLEKQKKELNATWEDRCRTESTKLKQDLSRLHTEEKRVAVEAAKSEKDEELSQAKQTWEKQRQELRQEISKLKDTATDKEGVHQKEVEKVRAQADRDGWEMRRQLDKLTGSHLEQLDKLKESHSEETERLKEAHEQDLARIDELQNKVLALEKAQREMKEKSLPPPPLPPNAGIPVEIKSVKVTPLKSLQSADSSSDEEDVDEEDEEEETTDESSEESSKDGLPNGIDGLRQEVATLQGSIKKLTSELTQESDGPGTPLSTSASTSATSQSGVSEAASSAMTSESGDLTYTPILLLGLIPFIAYTFFRSYLVFFWTFLVLIAYYLNSNETPK